MLQLRIALRPAFPTVNSRNQNLLFHESPASYRQLDLDMFWHRALLCGDMRTRQSRHSLGYIGIGSNDCLMPTLLQESQHRFHFGAHVAGRKMAGVGELLQLARSHNMQWSLCRLLVIEINIIRISRDHEKVATEPRCQQG